MTPLLRNPGRSTVRAAAVAGAFYPDDPRQLRQTIERLLPDPRAPAPAIAVVSPHAGYRYSGGVAARVLAQVEIPSHVILLGPNHTGSGRPFSIMTDGAWQTPLGTVPIDRALAGTLTEATEVLEPDEEAQRDEHSIEVQVPWLQVLQPALSIVPIVLAHAPLATYRRIGEGIAVAVRQAGIPILMVASTDMTHYEPHEAAKAKDSRAIEAIVALDPERLWHTVRRWEISMCGVAPTLAMLFAAKALGAGRGTLVEYRTSGDATGEYDAVVGYAGVVIR